MNENNAEIPLQETPGAETPLQETSSAGNPVPENPVAPAPTAPLTPEKPKRRIPKVVWIAGCASLLFLCAAFIVTFVYFGLPFLQGDPIASVAPNNSLMYMSVDLTQTQSQKFNDIFAVAQQIAEAEKSDTPAESMDKLMKDEFNMSFTEDIVPWVGRYGALVVTEGDLSSGDLKLMFIFESRNKGKADEFLKKFIAGLEKKQNMKFSQSEKDGITFYIHKANSEYSDMVIARNGKFVYLSNFQDTILESAKLKKSDAMSTSKGYKDGLAALPKNRLMTVYLSGNALTQSINKLSNQAYGLNSSYMKGMLGEGLTGIAISLSMEEQGLRMDTATVYDEAKLNDYQKQILATKYLHPKADALFSKDTFLFIGTNTSQALSSYTKVDNPLYSSDVQESFDLMKKQYGVNLQDLLNLLNGEFALAVAPAKDGLLAQAGGANLGVTILAGTNDEAGFVNWLENVLKKTSQNTYMDYDTSNIKVGDYSLKKLTVQDSSGQSPFLIYGADNGYIVLGSSQSMLESGLTSKKTLANDEIYRQTWAAFPKESVPYIYLNLKDFMNFLVKNSGTAGNEMRDAQKKLKQIPVIAIAMNNPSSSVQSLTMIVFIDKSK